ncbi:MAG: type I DNA topoisomerase [Christensenellales bacterium]|jgi:DNA topoisomerase-1
MAATRKTTATEENKNQEIKETTTKKAPSKKEAAAKKTAAASKKPAAAKKSAKGDKLVVVESPAKAKTITKFLGKGFRVVASNGHVRDLPKSQLGVDVENNFAPKYITLRGRGEVLDRIRKEAKSAKTIYLATDPDREGEAISWHLAQVLGIDSDEKCRIVFNEITPNAVKNAIKFPRSLDLALVDAQQARRLLDRLVGYKLSPLLWAKVRKGLSAGRVQSVATRILCDREEQIRAFVPEEYWVITALLAPEKAKKNFEAKLVAKNGKKFEAKCEADAMAAKEALVGATYRAFEVKKTEKLRNAPPPFTTSNLQQEAARKLGFTTKRTMLIAQQLYEGVEVKGVSTGLVTYIRTDSVRVSAEAQEAARALLKARFGEPYVPEKPNVFKGRKNAQDAHEAIRPTYPEMTPDAIKQYLTPEQFKLYRLIYNRFLASQMTPARIETVSVLIHAQKQGEQDFFGFKATGSRVLFDGYTAIYTEGQDNGEEQKESRLPAIAEGDEFACSDLKAVQHFTQPPMRYTEASLVRELEEKGIGRPSTFAPTITTIIERGYVKREKRVLYPTELGEIVTRLMKENFPDIVDVKFTAEMEEKLDEVEEGKLKGTELLAEFYGPFKETLERAEATIEKVEIADEVSDTACEKCGAMMVYKTGRFGRFLACPNFPNCRNTKPITEPVGVPCPKCGAKILKRYAKKGGKPFYGCESYPECDFVCWDPPAKEKCANCGGFMVQKNSRSGAELKCTSCGNTIKAVKHAEE